jgi:teichuronic acid biosynthesis glycosyltransferase TuaG
MSAMTPQAATAPVSVVIPCWRSAGTIRRAVDSALQQTRPPAEILLIDDASDDDGATRCVLHGMRAAHRANVPRLKVIELERNTGPGGARNAGWDGATQPYVAFLDADDAWHPRKLEIQTRWMDARPHVALSGHGSVHATSPDVPVIAADPPARAVSTRDMLISNRFPARSVMLRRELPFRFRGKRYAEDYLLWLEIVCAGHEAWRLDAPLAFHFRPEFAPGGYSGQLWIHERRELNALTAMLGGRRIGLMPYTLAASWSFAKYLRRVAIHVARRGRG